MNKQLLKDLPELITANIISEETAFKIVGYYKQEKQTAPNILTVVLAILGALLVGSGILLVIAHNWDELSRPVKTTLSFFPLLAAQFVCVYTLLKRKGNISWRECSGVLLFFAIGACISLVSQIYQVSGSLSGFLLSWVLLGLPMVYILSSSTVAILCLAAITWYAAAVGYSDRPGSIPFMYGIVILLLAPHYYFLFKKRSGSNYLNLLNWFFAVSLTITLGSFSYNQGSWFEWVFLLYCILFCIYYLVGRSDFFNGKRLIANPFLILGLTGIVSIFLIWSFSFLWDEHKTPVTTSILRDPLPYLIFFGIIVLIIMFWKNRRFHFTDLPDPSPYSFVVLLLLLITLGSSPATAMFIINAWIFLIALYYIRRGSKEDHFGVLNVGLVILASLSICRFFDDTIPFIWRGLFFVATGAGFFIANYLMLRKRKQLIKPE